MRVPFPFHVFLLSKPPRRFIHHHLHLLLLSLPLCRPYSGLDSTSAVALIRLLNSLARSHGKTVITSIHQPNSALFRSFDKLLMLAEGSVVYFGKPTNSLQYLQKQNLICPDGYNAADHWMDLLVSDSAIDEERDVLYETSIIGDNLGTTERSIISTTDASFTRTARARATTSINQMLVGYMRISLSHFIQYHG